MKRLMVMILVAIMLLIPLTALAVPTDAPVISVTGITASTARVSWESVTDAETYSVKLDGTLIDGSTTENLYYDIQGLDAETEYSVTAYATNAGSENSADSNAVVFTTAESMFNLTWIGQIATAIGDIFAVALTPPISYFLILGLVGTVIFTVKKVAKR